MTILDPQMTQQQITGYAVRLKALREKEEKFIEAETLNREAQKARTAASTVETELQSVKEELAMAQAERNEAVQKTALALGSAMNAVLPEGESIFAFDENGKLSLGWKVDGVYKPYYGLSGGEKVAFDTALAKAMGAGVLIVEAAELDGNHLTLVLEKLSQTGLQTIVLSCHEPCRVPLGFTRVDFNKEVQP